MAHKVVITQSTAGRSGPPQTMLDVLEEAGIDVEVVACGNENNCNAFKGLGIYVGKEPNLTSKSKRHSKSRNRGGSITNQSFRHAL